MIYTSPEFERLNKARMQELVQDIRGLARANNQQQQGQSAVARLFGTRSGG